MTRPSLRWHVPAPVTEYSRALLAECLGCAFTDESTPRPGLCAAPDVAFVAIAGPDHLTLVAHFRDVGLPFATKTAWLHAEVTRACELADMPPPTGPSDITTGR